MGKNDFLGRVNRVKTTLAVMAAGMGSRFGGLKQLAPVGPNGETLLNFSVYDAKAAGFDKVVFIIKKAIEDDFREILGKKIEGMIDVDYAFQELDMLPEWYEPSAERVKPYGTGHAILCAEKQLTTPFAVINADDYYGKQGYKLIHEHLITEKSPCMAGFLLKNTLSENGTVSRGICETENGYLKTITEHTALDKNSPFSPETIVSMNMWGFNNDIFGLLNSEFEGFLKNMENPLKGEYYLPTFVDTLINKEGKNVKVFTTEDKWYGMTYKEDTELVKNAISDMVEKGLYK